MSTTAPVARPAQPERLRRARSRVGVVGYGAIGAAVGRALAEGRVEGAELVAVVDNLPALNPPVPQVALADAVQRCDVLVEGAGQAFVAQHGATILESGTDLLVSSVGALADPAVADRVLGAGPGRVVFTSGAVGGIDLLTSAAASGGIDTARVTSTKLPATLLQPWMDDATQERIRTTTAPLDVFRGNAREASLSFPRSLNVAATIALAVGGFDKVEVRLVADPAADLTRHVIEAHGEAGSYRFETANRPSADNPRTSGVVPQAVLRSLSALVGHPARIV
jgi:aspartate dehydrogenase